ncbi:hypothetical protein C2E25_02505 [Geothermobacter hydrogeniphilus]|uniref:Uncharacterized protein n=1 Tax=Geothermobacter hydrogeniphilus TaxID=1969733 RepID=A0A2K2HDX0_9BACT|nr:hypothetical protein [Geothermobacter hydrogeniphilus]PNU21443.1 hypothetical protein C2E25_02505 [Geothermobacter hydrogeniphilus]
MQCACPKCKATIEIQELEIPVEGEFQYCSECNEKYWVGREDFTLRVYRKQGNIYCSDCGHELGCENLCLNCGSFFPAYILVQEGRPAVRKQQRSGFFLARKPVRRASEPVRLKVEAEKITGSGIDRRWLAYSVLAVLVVVLAVGATGLYRSYQQQKAYARNFVIALYGIKSGVDLNLKAAAARTAAWRKQEGSMAVLAPPPAEKERQRLAKVKGAIDTALEALGETPEPAVAARQTLDQLYSAYLKLYSLNQENPSSLEDFLDRQNRLKGKFFKTAETLKSQMPDNIMEELRDAIPKYRNLSFLI